MNRESLANAMGLAADYPLVAPEGGKEALQADFAEYSAGHGRIIAASDGFFALISG